MDWFHQLPVAWMAVVVFAGIGVVTAGIYFAVQALAAHGWTPAFKAVSPVTLTPLAVIFGLIVGFLCAQVWSDGERANGAVIREAGALRTVLLLATIVILSLAARGEAQATAQREMIAAFRSALDARGERLVISRARINWVKWTVVLLLGGLILVTVALVHSDNRRTAAIAMALFAIGMASCVVLIASHNEPFTGEISVSPSLLLQIMPKE